MPYYNDNASPPAKKVDCIVINDRVSLSFVICKKTIEDTPKIDPETLADDPVRPSRKSKALTKVNMLTKVNTSRKQRAEPSTARRVYRYKAGDEEIATRTLKAAGLLRARLQYRAAKEGYDVLSYLTNLISDKDTEVRHRLRAAEVLLRYALPTLRQSESKVLQASVSQLQVRFPDLGEGGRDNHEASSTIPTPPPPPVSINMSLLPQLSGLPIISEAEGILGLVEGLGGNEDGFEVELVSEVGKLGYGKDIK